MIIDKLGIKKSNFALMTKELENEGLVEARQGEIDRRCRLMTLTEKGQKELDAFMKKLSDFFSEHSPEVEHAVETLCTFLNKKI